MTATVTIAEREFKGFTRVSTLAHDIWVMKQIRKCGLQKIEQDADEPNDAFAQRVFLEVASDPDFMTMLGGLLLPVEANESDWTPESAAETGAFLLNVSSPEDKQAVKSQVVAALILFFETGLASLRTSPKSSL